ncbi:MAG: carbamoyl phosphate synthase small subunit [Oscillospiraceae bacterium]
MIFENKKKASLVLANGTVFEGRSVGAQGKVIGEVVFTTSMVGYQETLTDPTYCGQIIAQTFPLIGNYGINSEDDVSAHHAAGYIIREYCEQPSNFRSEGTLEDYLTRNNVIGLCDIDTRALTRIIRENGVMNGAIVCGDFNKEELVKEINAFSFGRAVPKVSVSEKQKYAADNAKCNVVLLDLGMRAELKDELVKRGCNVTVMPYNSTAEAILAEKPDGLMLSGGPGDPADNTEVIETVKALCEKKLPIFAVCMGHQVLAAANGIKTYKLKYGHRGASQPVKNFENGKTYITSQNTGYAVDKDSIPDGVAEITHINGNDGVCEGLKYLNIPAFSTQFAPDTSGSPHDTGSLYDSFIKMMEENK